MSIPVFLCDPNYKIGTHIYKHDNFYKSIQPLCYTPLRSFQMYIKSPKSFSKVKINKEYIKDCLKTADILDSTYKYLVIHGSLLYNLSGSTFVEDDKLEEKTNRMIDNLKDELDIASIMNSGVIVHFGSCKDENIGIKRMINNINRVLTEKGTSTSKISKYLDIDEKDLISKRKLILENSAGEGTRFGSRIYDIKNIFNKYKHKYEDTYDNIKLCIDTAHLYGAGQYDMGKKDDFYNLYNDCCSELRDKIEVFHFNDSEASFNSKKDRHASFRSGKIWNTKESLEGCKVLTDFLHNSKIPFIGEPPEPFDISYDRLNKFIPLETEYKC